MRFLALLFLILGAISAPAQVNAAQHHPPRYKAVAFDYFVLFDPDSIIPDVEAEFPGKGAQFARAWRSKQFEYAFLSSITHERKDFFQLTGDALDFTADQMHLPLMPETRARLLNAYMHLKLWPDSVSALQRLRAEGVRVIVLSNLTPEMLRENAKHAGIADLLEDQLSTRSNHTFKPDPRAYALGTQRLRLNKDQIVFAAFGGWDAVGAKDFGYPTVWINRFDLPAERLGASPDKTSRNLDGLLEFVLGK